MHDFQVLLKEIFKYLRSGLVYKFQCAGCNAIHYGKRKRHFKVRACEHLGISPLIGKRVTPAVQSTAIKDHILYCQHSPTTDDFIILCSEFCLINSMRNILTGREKHFRRSCEYSRLTS